MTDLTHLDAKTLKAFVDHDVADFIQDAKDIRKDTKGGSVPALRTLVSDSLTGHSGEDPFLAVGLLKNLKAGLPKQVAACATSIDNTLKAQITLGTDIQDVLGVTITTLLDTQDGSLVSIDGQKLIDLVAPLDDDLSGGSTSESGGSTQ
ncbi:type VII secretion system-associated protein [Streptomyces sp. NPDC047000]|uniref:type VII secretion system-associated protein n=1 Tax=Streptomyces sp. NPDC047000 TaxID=3155474 RepID=UPI00340A9CF7